MPSIKTEFKIEVNNIASVGGMLKGACAEALEKVGAAAEGNAKTIVHVVTGNLRNSIDHRVDAERLEAIIGSDVEYAEYEEVGTRRRRGHPYIRPALENNIGQYEKIFAETFKQNGLMD